MNNLLPRKNAAIFRTIVGESIVAVRRRLFDSDLVLPDFEQNADGPIEITFRSGKVIHFIALTEQLSVGIGTGAMPKYGTSYITRDVSGNSFWQTRFNKRVNRVDIIRSSYSTDDDPNDYAIKFSLEGGPSFFIVYINTEEVLDTIRVVNKLEQQSGETLSFIA